jgi:predicted DNA repair protein MutK
MLVFNPVRAFAVSIGEHFGVGIVIYVDSYGQHGLIVSIENLTYSNVYSSTLFDTSDSSIPWPHNIKR